MLDCCRGFDSVLGPSTATPSLPTSDFGLPTSDFAPPKNREQGARAQQTQSRWLRNRRSESERIHVPRQRTNIGHYPGEGIDRNQIDRGDGGAVLLARAVGRIKNIRVCIISQGPSWRRASRHAARRSWWDRWCALPFTVLMSSTVPVALPGRSKPIIGIESQPPPEPPPVSPMVVSAAVPRSIV